MGNNKKSYVIDECCIYHAARLVNEKNEEDFTAIHMLTAIKNHCDKILVNRKLLQFYHKLINKLQQQGNKSIFLLLKLIDDLIPNKSKFIFWETELYKLPNDEELPSDDVYLIRLAKITNSILITSDLRLIEKINPNKDGYSQKYQIHVLTPQQVIKEISLDITN